ncbi:MAG: hypothetical protein CBC29_09200 [Methylococcaceae bacterium TMED69]|nr:MAG: hypothetical protein CBC29_09200 [Methylococcaceae bacterium TMED69]
MELASKIGTAALLVAMLIFLIPQAKNIYANTRKGTSSEWLSFAVIICGIFFFVLILTKFV